jgi:hypothetical protein
MVVSTIELRRRAKKTIDQLSEPHLRFVTDFLAYIKERQPEEATRELLDIPGFIEAFARGTQNVRTGRVRPWRKVRREV